MSARVSEVCAPGQGISKSDPSHVTRDPVDAKEASASGLHGRVLPTFRRYGRDANLGNRLCGIALRLTRGMALSSLLVIGTQIQAECCQGVDPDLPPLNASAVLQNDGDLAVSASQTRVAARPKSSTALVVERTNSETPVSQSLPINRSEMFVEVCARETFWAGPFFSPQCSQRPVPSQAGPEAEGNRPRDGSKEPSIEPSRIPIPPDFNRSIYYKNKFEFGLDVGWLPINIPFVFDFLLGDGYNMTPLKYTLVPIIASVRWQMDDVGGPWILRGNWDLSFSGSVTAIPRGPETRYFSYIMGIRRNFVPRKWRVAPYVDGRLGLGNIDAKGPDGVAWAQGENFTFTLNLGSGFRYNFSPRYSLSAGMNYMHISNLYLSEPRYKNYGINVYGPMVGIDVRLGRPHRDIAP